MPNHYHLLLQSSTKGDLSLFMRKLNGGYSRYFNTKHDRSGALFQGKYKSVLVRQESHLLHLPYYIHGNPLDLVMPEWRKKTLNDYKKALRFLEDYKWSSFPDYIGGQNFPSVTQREFLMEFYGGPTQYKKSFVSWLRNFNPETMEHLLLE